MTSLPDVVFNGGRHKSVERVLVSYPCAESEEVRKARIARGDPAPTLSFVVGTIVRNDERLQRPGEPEPGS